MDFDVILNRCIKVFSDAKSSDSYCLERYSNIVSLLNEMQESVKEGIYPRNYSVLPLFRYIERNMDSDEMYEVIKELDAWYAENYREKE